MTGSDIVKANPEIVDLLKAHLRCAPIPKELKFEGWQTSKDNVGDKPIHDWIEHRQGEAIPKELKFEGWQTSKGYDGKPIHYWKKYRPDEPIPEDLQCDESSNSNESSDSDESSYSDSSIVSCLVDNIVDMIFQ